ncbi:hypothetical protein RD792_009462 [Penstemon davidsonii]|uniref:PSII 6.1 kDa protein n=1 Tax=Penstemon davidsonii TaxID=160366 RepID=A0ABR0CZW0_9LAMI|nr:hypothetical protein RD792_009462 [Penstemon davidsonii]
MATISACTTTSSIARATLVRKASVVRTSAILGLPSMGKVKCSMEGKAVELESESKLKLGLGLGMGTSLMAAAMSSPGAMALVDERMSTEGTGLPFGLSSNLLGWLLLGVFALIWSLYFVYTSGLEEDEESGLSL